MNYEEIVNRDLHDIRKNIFLAASVAGMGHLASAYSSVEILYTLYMSGILKNDPQNPNAKERDRLILSKGHASLALYAVLNKAGFISESELMTFCRPGSFLGGEPHSLEIPGVEASTGSLGHGLSIAVGMAIALKTDNIDNNVYVILGDGECQEGSIWEAVMSANKYHLDNLTVILDCNGIQKMGSISEIMGITSWNSIWESFGWIVESVDGHNVSALKSVLSKPRVFGKPRIIIANTVKGKGISIMENNPAWHFKMPNKKELRIIMSELEITEEEIEKCRKHT